MQNNVKPYLARIKNWKIRNMVMLYLEARDTFIKNRKLQRNKADIPYDKMREVCDVLYEIKEDHHLLYMRIVDPKKNKYEDGEKFVPDDCESAFINNVGLLFHKVMVARELKYVLEHYVEDSTAVFKRNKDSFTNQIQTIDALFNEGIEMLKVLIAQNSGNLLLLTLLLENPNMAKKHFGKSAHDLIAQFGNGNGLSEVFFLVGQYYANCGRIDKAKKMLRDALRKNSKHLKANQLMAELQI